MPGPSAENHERKEAHDGQDRDQQAEDGGVESTFHDPILYPESLATERRNLASPARFERATYCLGGRGDHKEWRDVA